MEIRGGKYAPVMEERRRELEKEPAAPSPAPSASPPSLGLGTGSISKKQEINRTEFVLETVILIRISVHSLYSHLQMAYLYFLLLMFS